MGLLYTGLHTRLPPDVLRVEYFTMSVLNSFIVAVTCANVMKLVNFNLI